MGLIFPLVPLGVHSYDYLTSELAHAGSKKAYLHCFTLFIWQKTKREAPRTVRFRGRKVPKGSSWVEAQLRPREPEGKGQRTVS